MWKSSRLAYAGRTDVIRALFRLHTYLQDEKIDVVRFEEEDTRTQAIRPSVENDDRVPSRFKAPRTSRAIVKWGAKLQHERRFAGLRGPWG